MVPAAGQWFTDETGAVLSYRLWRRLGGDTSIVGRPMTLDGRALTIAGVMPPDFRLPISGPGGGYMEKGTLTGEIARDLDTGAVVRQFFETKELVHTLNGGMKVRNDMRHSKNVRLISVDTIGNSKPSALREKEY